MTFLSASPTVIQKETSVLHSGLPQTTGTHREDAKEILMNIERTGLALRHRRGMLTLEIL